VQQNNHNSYNHYQRPPSRSASLTKSVSFLLQRSGGSLGGGNGNGNGGNGSPDDGAAAPAPLDADDTKNDATPLRTFALAFCSALERGDASWATTPAVAATLHERIRFVGVDGAVHEGRPAAARRLNQAVAQLVAAAGGGGGGDSANGNGAAGEAAAAIAAAATAAAAAAAAQRAGGGSARLLRVLRLGPTTHAAFYRLTWGTRAFDLRDEAIVRDGVIVRLRRSRGHGEGGAGGGGAVAAVAMAAAAAPGRQRPWWRRLLLENG